MGILEELGKTLGGQPAGAGGQGTWSQGALVQAIMGLLTSGGLQQLISSFQQKGLGDVIGSWVSTGPNAPISPDQLQQALGPERIGDLSARTGLDAGALAGQLSNLLPGLVDKLTPDGKVPEQGALQERLGGVLKSLF
jgi:uncharacterized protein YidB (DUF937 family)